MSAAGSGPRWVAAVLELPEPSYDVGVGFWSAVMGRPPRVERSSAAQPRVRVELHEVLGEASVLPPVADWGTHTSIVDQVCVDIPPADYEEECARWAAKVGVGEGSWRWAETGHEEFRRLQPLAGQAWRLLLQRRREGSGPVTAHLDLATSSRELETRRHESLGATVRDVFAQWTVLSDPTGLVYCITDRSPGPSQRRRQVAS